MIAERSYEPDELFRCFGDNPSEAATKRRVERRFEFTEGAFEDLGVLGKKYSKRQVHREGG
jgi:hypothetical protein